MKTLTMKLLQHSTFGTTCLGALAFLMLYAVPPASSAPATVDYHYDADSRLVTVARKDHFAVHYQYDAAGNRTKTLVVTDAAPQEDTDGNDLSDLWELQFIGHLGNEPGQDSDDDALTNGEEESAWTDPVDAGSFLSILLLRPDPEQTTVWWQAHPFVTYRIRWTEDLTLWPSGNEAEVHNGVYVDPFPPKQRFYQILAE